MPNIKLYLKDPNAEGPTPIFLVAFVNGRRLKISTKKSVKPNQWSTTSQKVINHQNASTVNILLNQMCSELERIIDTRIILKKDLNIRNIKEDFEETFGRKKRMKTFFDYYEKFMENKSHQVSAGTIRNYKSTLRRLTEFERHSRCQLDFDLIDENFIRDFSNYLLNVVNCFNDSLGKHIKTLKIFMRSHMKKVGLETGYSRILPLLLIPHKGYQVFRTKDTMCFAQRLPV